MNICQLFYTSCKKGLSSGMGFQTYSMSEGISEEEREEIERHCFYTPPDNLPGNPAEEEIEALFPIAFSFYKLKNGKSCISRAKYIGRDYSGRFGNYFCHVLIIDEKDLHFYPIEIYDSPVFRDGLIEEEENAENIEPLPILHELPKGNVVTLESIEKFLKEEAAKKRTKSLNELIDGIIDAKINNKRIFFCDNKAMLPFWIGAVTMMLPVRVANSITFNTYIFDGQNNEEFICGSLKDGIRIDFMESNERYKYNLFNFEDGLSCEFNFRSKFAKQAALGYTIVKDYRKAFINFMGLFQYRKIDENIDNCVNLLSLVNNGLEKLNDEEALKAIDFANKYAAINALEQIMIKLNEETLKKITAKLNLNLAEVIFKFLFRIAKLSGKKEYMDKAYIFFFDSLHFMTVNAEEIQIEKIIELHNSIRDFNRDNIKGFISKSIESKRLESIVVFLQSNKSRYAKFYFCTIIGDLIGLPWQAFGNNGSFPKFVEKALNILVESKEELKFALNYVFNNSNKDYFVSLIAISYRIAIEKKKVSTVIELLNEFLSRLSDEEIYEIIRNLYESSLGCDILIASYKMQMENSNDKIAFFKKYCNNEFVYNPKYKREAFSIALEELFYYYSYETFTIDDYMWFLNYMKNERLETALKESLVQKLVTVFQKIIPISIVGYEIQHLISDVNDIKNWYGISIKPDIAEIVQYANELYQSKKDINRFLADERNFKFQGIEEIKYEEILNLMFKIICPRLKDEVSHIRLKRIFMYEEFSETYLINYIKVISDIFNEVEEYENKLNNSYKEAYEVYFDGVYFLLKSQKTFSDNQRDYIKDSIIKNLKNLDKEKLHKYNLYMHSIISNTSIAKEIGDITEQWEEIYEVLIHNKKEKSLFKFIKDKTNL